MPIYTKPGQETITKAPPIDFLSTGEPLTAWSIYGNGRQTGAPTPASPIQPEFVGVRTENLLPQTITTSPNFIYFCKNSPIHLAAGTYTAKIFGYSAVAYFINYETGGTIGRYGTDGTTVTLDSNKDVYIQTYGSGIQTLVDDAFCVVVSGSTAPTDFIPYGYKIPISCAGQTVPVYLGQTQTVRRIKKLVLTGSESFTYDSEYTRFSLPITDALILGTRKTPAFCTHYQCIDDGRSITSVPNNSIYGAAGSVQWYLQTADYSTEADLKAYLQQQYAAGTPITVWYVLETPETAIVNEPLCKIGDYADELHSADAQITIPTSAGHNTLTVDTTLPPSSVSITAPDIYHQVDRIMCNVNGTQTEIAKVVDNQNNLIFTPKNWFGFKIDTTNDDSSTAVTYTHSAVTMTPAFMDYTNGVFNYGSWKNVWFIKNSYPVALNFDGTEAYKLDPDDYTKRLDGTPSDIQYVLQTEEPSNWSTQWKQYYTKSGDDYVMNSQSEAPTWAADTYYTLTCLSSTVNFMLAFPKVYFRRYTDSQYNHVEIADRKIDNNWYAYAHVNTNGVEVDYIYLPLFKGSIVDSKLRSIPGVIPTGGTTASAEVNAATALGSRWQIWDHSSRELINDLLILMSKSIDCQTAFGRGRESGYNADDTVTYGKLPTGTAIRKGPFYGSSTSLSEVKVFGMESFWANRWDRLQGILLVDNIWTIKMTPPYNFTGTDFTTLTQFDVPSGNGYLSKVTASQYGSIPASISGGASNKFYRDYFYKTDTGTRVGLVGGRCGNGAASGFRYVNVYTTASASTWDIGASPIYK